MPDHRRRPSACPPSPAKALRRLRAARAACGRGRHRIVAPWLAVAALALVASACGSGGKDGGGGNLALCPPRACEVATARDGLGNCTYAARADGSACEDGNPCTTLTTCTAGRCGGGAMLADGAACDDGDACTVGEACHAGTCGGGGAVRCPAATACRGAAACDPRSGCPDTTLAACVENLPDVPLQGCVDGGYVAPIEVAGVRYGLLVDTGSSTTALAAATCSNCTVTPTYPMAGRKTFGQAASQYSDGSGWSGSVVYDLVSAPGGAADGDWLLAFGAVTAQQNNFFRGQACSGTLQPNAYQGILGLAPQSGASAGTTAFVDAAVTGNALVHDAFALGLCDRTGRLWLGGYDPAATAAPPVFSPMLTPAVAGNYYGVAIDDVGLGAQSLGKSSQAVGPALVDSGTSGLFLPLDVYAALVGTLQQNGNFTALFGSATLFANTAFACAAPSQNLSPQQLDDMLPPLTLTVPRVGSGEPATLVLAASQSYLTAAQQTTASGSTRYVYCTGVYPSVRTTVIGAAALRGLVVVFDRAHGQVGFAAQLGCDPALPVLPPG